MSEKSDIVEGIKILFQRPNEPSFTKKDNGKTAFELPLDFYSERYKNIGSFLSSRMGEDVERTVHLRQIQRPNLDFTSVIKLHGPFSLFNKTHQRVAGELIKIMLETTQQDFVSMAVYIKDRVNPYLFLVSSTEYMNPNIFLNVLKFHLMIIRSSMRWQLLFNIEKTLNIYRCHQLCNNFQINS